MTGLTIDMRRILVQVNNWIVGVIKNECCPIILPKFKFKTR